MLLCLDNCEHLIESCAQVCQRLLASSPGLRMIATSREPLRVAAETVWQVPPLPRSACPASLGWGGPGYLRRDHAVRRPGGGGQAGVQAHGCQPGPAVTAICRSLDGLPLAIELAATWVRALIGRADRRPGSADRFQVLNSADRTAPAGTARCGPRSTGAMTCFRLPSRILLRRLSVFADWPLEMAELVCARAADLDASGVLDVLTGARRTSHWSLPTTSGAARSGTGCSTRSASTRPSSLSRRARPVTCTCGSAGTRYPRPRTCPRSAWPECRRRGRSGSTRSTGSRRRTLTCG